MAIYAFDGTWNEHRKNAETDTNVLWFRNAYQQRQWYQKGVGTRVGKLGAIVGGISGAGGRSRIAKALESLQRSFDEGDRTIDIVGFSRGAALALHFANRVNHDGVPGHRRSARTPIRFLGLWDTVGSFGVPGNRVNLAWDLDLPDNVDKCYHALALDERRRTFPVTRLSARVHDVNQEGRLFEVWFRGVHSDVGGGNGNPGLSSIPLNWMFAKGLSCGLLLDVNIVKWNLTRMKPEARVSPAPKYDLIKNGFRAVRWNDQVHHSVAFRDSRSHNNPPLNCALVDDGGAVVGAFAHA